jgi:hypothetical protein
VGENYSLLSCGLHTGWQRLPIDVEIMCRTRVFEQPTAGVRTPRHDREALGASLGKSGLNKHAGEAPMLHLFRDLRVHDDEPAVSYPISEQWPGSVLVDDESVVVRIVANDSRPI